MMGSGIKESLAALISKTADLYKEIVTTNVKFEGLRTSTKETLDEFKRLLERQEDQIERVERDRIKNETELLSKINALEARLSALSEQALHAAAKEAARMVMQDRLQTHSEVHGPTRLESKKREA
jgi:chromosome segregation ATPase